MPKQKYDWWKMKMEFMLSEYDEAKGFMQDKYKIYNGEIAKNVKWWWKEKIAYKQKIYEEALKKKWKETAKEISDNVWRYEMLNEEMLERMENEFEENKRPLKKWEKRRKLNSNDIMNMWKISRTERWLPTNITKTDNTNRDERTELSEKEQEAFDEFKKRMKNK